MASGDGGGTSDSYHSDTCCMHTFCLSASVQSPQVSAGARHVGLVVSKWGRNLHGQREGHASVGGAIMTFGDNSHGQLGIDDSQLIAVRSQ